MKSLGFHFAETFECCRLEYESSRYWDSHFENPLMDPEQRKDCRSKSGSTVHVGNGNGHKKNNKITLSLQLPNSRLYVQNESTVTYNNVFFG